MEKTCYEDAYLTLLRSKAEDIDQIADRAILHQNKKLHEKYSNIENTVKILKNLIIEFTKKADQLEKKLIAEKKINEIKQRDEYYQKRVEEYIEESDLLREKIRERSSEFKNL